MGHINIKLADLICEKGESKNKVCYHCEIQRTQLNLSLIHISEPTRPY